MTRGVPRLFFLLLVVGCSGGEADQAGSAQAAPADTASAAPVNRIAATYLIPLDSIDAVHSPAVWRRRDGSGWLIASAEASHALLLYDAVNGALLRRFSSAGRGPGQLRRPRGLLVNGDLLFVIDGDNHRIQVLRLPDLQTLGTFGAEELRHPNAITGYRASGRALEIYIADQRVFHFRVTDGRPVRAQLVNTFADTLSAGTFLHVDEENGRLLLANQIAREIEIYTLDGMFTGATMGAGVFDAIGDMALWGCAAEGYWVIADGRRLQVFDRATLRHVGSFAAEDTTATQGLALVTGTLGTLQGGALYAVQDDRGIGAFAWNAVADGLGLRVECTERE